MINLNNYHYIHRLAKRTVPFLKKKNKFTKVLKREKNNQANIHIAQLIQSKTPFMVARYGRTEAQTIINYLESHKQQNDLYAIYRYLNGNLNIFWKKHPKFLNNLCTLSGFFPNDEKLLGNFVKLMIECNKNLDVLGVWNELEEYLPNIPEDVFLCELRELEPWFFENPWSKYLEDRKVLVIHPFEESIITQYNKTIKGGGDYIKTTISYHHLN